MKTQHKGLLLGMAGLLCLPVWAQKRMVPHITLSGGNFVTEILIANAAPEPRDYLITAFDNGGMPVGMAAAALPAGTTLVATPETLFQSIQVAYLQIDDESQVQVTVSYRANRAGSGWAHLAENRVQAEIWRVYPGNSNVTWDGWAIVNCGDASADVTVRQVGLSGAIQHSVTALSNLAAGAKGLYLPAIDFPCLDAAFYEISASQPLALTALRGNLASDFLWENSATPTLAVQPQPVAAYHLEDAFPGQFFPAPVDFEVAPDGSGRAFVVNLNGTIDVFSTAPGAPPATAFLDITARITLDGEMGLLGLAFHPNFASNGYFFVHYATEQGGPRRSVISRWRVAPEDSNRADPNSEQIFLEVNQPQTNHNGGKLAFGPHDGMLYIGLGDGGGSGDPLRNGQNPTTLLGSILRLDVDQAGPSAPYTIPEDNPFAGHGDGFRGEIYAYGFRNPWRLSFDEDCGSARLWVGDVGQDRYEEINLVRGGGNYGWNSAEGNHCFSPPLNCNIAGFEAPFFEYNHDQGDQSITGGYVYRGSRLPELYGAYLFADFISGRVWALRDKGTAAPEVVQLTDFNGGQIVAFGRDSQGEVYLCTLSGIIHRLSRAEP